MTIPEKVALVGHWDWVLYHFRLPIARALRERGWEPLFICPAGPYVGRLQAEGYRWVEWRVGRRSVNPVRELVALLRLVRIYLRERPKVVHHFTIKPNIYGSLASRVTRVPLVINTFSGLGYVFSDAWQARLLRLAVGALLRTPLRAANTWTVVQNPVDYAELIRRRWAEPARIRLISGSGVDVGRFVPRQGVSGHNGESAPPVILLAGRLLRSKGIGEFVAAAGMLAEQGLAARFRIAGVPDPGNPDTVTDADLRDWQRGGHVEFLGQRSDMDRVLREADVAVLPSYYPEGVPRFLLEAAATGLPIVATDIPGVRLVVRPGVNGLLVPPRDPHALVSALAALLQNAGLRAQMGTAGRRIAVEEFAERRIVGEYMALYESIGAWRDGAA